MISAQEMLDAIADVEPTPGPWRIFDDGTIGSAAVRRSPATDVLQPGSVKGETIAVAMQNARLIAIAPEMRDLLEAVLVFHSGGEWTCEKQGVWFNAIQRPDATTRNLCDAIREVLGKSRPRLNDARATDRA